MCRKLECKNYIEWEYVSDRTCVSCTEVGQSHNIEEYPANCPYKVELKEYHKQCEQKEIWKQLNAVNDYATRILEYWSTIMTKMKYCPPTLTSSKQ